MILKLVFSVFIFLLDCWAVYIAKLKIEDVINGDFPYKIDANSNEWYYTSTDMLILECAIPAVVIATCLLIFIYFLCKGKFKQSYHILISSFLWIFFDIYIYEQINNTMLLLR